MFFKHQIKVKKAILNNKSSIKRGENCQVLLLSRGSCKFKEWNHLKNVGGY